MKPLAAKLSSAIILGRWIVMGQTDSVDGKPHVRALRKSLLIFVKGLKGLGRLLHK